MSSNRTVKIGSFTLGQKHPVFVVAEMSANHCGDLRIARKTIKAMKKAGADAVKLQTYTPDTMTIDSDKNYFRIDTGSIWDGRTLYDLYKEAQTPWEWQAKLQKLAHDEGLEFFSSPFDKTSVDFLEDLDVPAYKIASFEITDIPLIEYAASKGKPMIFSTGLADKKDTEAAVKACARQGNKDIVLLKCTSAYPAPLDQMNLNAISLMAKDFNCPVGLSDHTLGSLTAITSVALGACMIEKHFILDKTLGGPDAKFSSAPEEFKEMVDAVRSVPVAMGKAEYKIQPFAKVNRMFCRSLFAVSDIKKGDKFTEDNVRSIRPGQGMAPSFFSKIVGKKASRAISRGTPLKKSMVTGL